MEFQAIGSRQVIATFDGGTLSTDGGALLLRDLDRSMGLTVDKRDAKRIDHSVQTMVAQRVLAIALGYEDLNDHQTLRHDPLLSAAAAKEHGEVLASAPTLNRLELSSHRSGRYHKVRVEAPKVRELLLKTGVQSLRRGQREVVIGLGWLKLGSGF